MYRREASLRVPTFVNGAVVAGGEWISLGVQNRSWHRSTLIRDVINSVFSIWAISTRLVPQFGVLFADSLARL
jgi:hypothetical protein